MDPQQSADLTQVAMDAIAKYGMEIVTLGGSVSPLIGGILAVLLIGVSFYLNFKAKRERVKKEQAAAGEQVQQETGSNQSTATGINEGIEDFFDDEDDNVREID